MEKILLKIAKEFNDVGIKWGIGGSLLLKKHALINIVNDIDIIVSNRDINRLIEILDRIASKVTAPVKQEYATKHFLQYQLNGISIDVMSQFIIKHDAGSYEFIFDDTSISDIVVIDNIQLPYTSLEDWLIAYMLMINREEKVNMIWNYFMTNGIRKPELIERALRQQLPEMTEKRLKELLYLI